MSQRVPQRLSSSKWTPLSQDAERLPSYFEDRAPRGFLWRNPPNSSVLAAQPKIDIAASDDELVVTAEVPGLKVGDLDISVTNDVMTLHAHEHYERDESAVEGRARSHQILDGSFVRHIRLPCAVDAEHASASYHDGTLRVLFPNAIHDRRETRQDDEDNVLTVYFGVDR